MNSLILFRGKAWKKNNFFIHRARNEGKTKRLNQEILKLKSEGQEILFLDSKKSKEMGEERRKERLLLWLYFRE